MWVFGKNHPKFSTLSILLKVSPKANPAAFRLLPVINLCLFRRKIASPQRNTEGFGKFPNKVRAASTDINHFWFHWLQCGAFPAKWKECEGFSRIHCGVVTNTARETRTFVDLFFFLWLPAITHKTAHPARSMCGGVCVQRHVKLSRMLIQPQFSHNISHLTHDKLSSSLFFLCFFYFSKKIEFNSKPSVNAWKSNLTTKKKDDPPFVYMVWQLLWFPC